MAQPVAQPMMLNDKLSLKSKVCYGMAEVGSQFSWTLISSYLTFFYTNVVGLTPVVISAIMLIARIWDAINDPMMGMIAERTRSRWGRFRPYLLWGAPVLALFNILTFTSLDISPVAKSLFCAFSYIFCGMAYTAVSICTGSLANVMTRDNDQRMQLGAFRGVGGAVAGFIISACTMPMILYFGQGDQNSPKGYLIAAIVYSVVAMFCFWIAFGGTKEVITLPPTQKKVPMRESLKIAFSDHNTLCMLVGMVLFLTGIFGRLGVMMYYFVYVLQNPGLMAGAAMAMTIGSALPNLYVPFLTARFDKKKLMSISCVLCAIACGIMFVGALDTMPTAVGLATAYVGMFLLGFCNWVALCNYGLTAEIIDDTQVRRNVRADGTIYSCISFSTKLGNAIGGSVGVLLLAAVGYVATADVQTPSAVLGMNAVINLGPALMFILAIIPFMMIRMTNKKGKENSEILAEREVAENNK